MNYIFCIIISVLSSALVTNILVKVLVKRGYDELIKNAEEHITLMAVTAAHTIKESEKRS